MFRAAYRSSSGAVTVFAASGLHTLVVTGRSQVWVGTQSEFPLRLDYGRSPHAYVNQRLQMHLELLMMSGIPLETCWAVNERWNNKFCYKVASCWLFPLSEIIYCNDRKYTCNVTKWGYTLCFCWQFVTVTVTELCRYTLCCCWQFVVFVTAFCCHISLTNFLCVYLDFIFIIFIGRT